MSVFHQSLFDMPRGRLVPRDEDADDEVLPIFEEPGAVPLGALVLVDKVEATAEQSMASMWYGFVCEYNAPAPPLETPLATAPARMDARVPRIPRTPLPLRVVILSLLSRSSRSASSRIARSNSSFSLRSCSFCAASIRSSSSRRHFSFCSRISFSSNASS